MIFHYPQEVHEGEKRHPDPTRGGADTADHPAPIAEDNVPYHWLNYGPSGRAQKTKKKIKFKTCNFLETYYVKTPEHLNLNKEKT